MEPAPESTPDTALSHLSHDYKGSGAPRPFNGTWSFRKKSRLNTSETQIFNILRDPHSSSWLKNAVELLQGRDRNAALKDVETLQKFLSDSLASMSDHQYKQETTPEKRFRYAWLGHADHFHSADGSTQINVIQTYEHCFFVREDSDYRWKEDEINIPYDTKAEAYEAAFRMMKKKHPKTTRKEFFKTHSLPLKSSK